MSSLLPSRTAKPENVRFYETPAEAEAAGFRPCQRCNPNGQSLAEVNATLVAEACRLIEASDEMPKLDELAARIGMSPYYFHRQFKAITGLTPKQWAAAHRSRRVRVELTDQTASVTGAIYGAGFARTAAFTNSRTRCLG